MVLGYLTLECLQGGVVVSRMQAKAGTQDWILAEFEACHQGKVDTPPLLRSPPPSLSLPLPSSTSTR